MLILEKYKTIVFIVSRVSEMSNPFSLSMSLYVCFRLVPLGAHKTLEACRYYNFLSTCLATLLRHNNLLRLLRFGVLG